MPSLTRSRGSEQRNPLMHRLQRAIYGMCSRFDPAPPFWQPERAPNNARAFSPVVGYFESRPGPGSFGPHIEESDVQLATQYASQAKNARAEQHDAAGLRR